MLTFLRVDLVDFMGFRGSHKISLDLEPGLYYLTGRNVDNPRMGPNACGKSTLFNSIYWCFTGELLDLVRPGDEVVPWLNSKKTVSVTDWFEIDERYYGLRRTRGPNSLLLKEGQDGEWKPVDQTTVRELLGLSNEALKHTIILGQFEDLFLDLPPKDQSQFFSEILSLDLWLQAAKEASDHRALSERLRVVLAEDKIRVEGLLTATQEQLAHAKEDRVMWNHERAEIIAEITEAISAEENNLADAKEVLAKAIKPTSVDAIVAEDRHAVRVLENKELKLTEDIASARAALAQFLSDQTHWQSVRKKLVDARSTKTCPECGQQVTLQHLDDKITEATRKLAALNLAISATQKEIDEPAKSKEEVKRKLKSAEETLFEKLRKQQELVDLYVNTERDVADAGRLVQATKDRLNKANREDNPHAATEERLAGRITSLTSDQALLVDKLTKQTTFSEAAALLETIFKEIRLSLIDEVLLELEVTIGNYAQQLGLEGWRIKFSTEKELKSGGVSVALTTMLYPPGIDKGINWHVYSGGERQRWQMAVTFGLSEVLLARAGLESNLEILDEPSHHTSAEGVEDLIEHLSERARQHKKAILFVDHHVLDRGLFDHTWVAVRENGASRLEVA